MKSIKEKLNNKGFTLIELITAAAIFAVIAIPIMYMFFTSQKDYILETRRVEAQSQINDAMRFILEDLRQVGSGEDVLSKASIELENEDDTDKSNDILVMRYENGGTPDIVAYMVIGGKLYKYKTTGDLEVLDIINALNSNPASGRVYADKVTEFMLAFVNNAYSISITIEPGVPLKPQTLTNKYVPRFYMDYR